MLFKAPAPRLLGESWVEGTKRADERAKESVRFGEAALAVLTARKY
jgi:hypothetical protein